MYKEHDLVLKSLNNIRTSFDNPVIIVVHSDDETQSTALDCIKDLANEYILLPDLSKNIPIQTFRIRIGSRAWGRNFSAGFSKLYEKYCTDYIIAFSGDTYIHTAPRLQLRINEMVTNNYVCYISRLQGQNLHEVTDIPEQGIQFNRPQGPESTDFLPTFFILDGEFGNKSKVFSSIEITNELTFEQCVGDDLVKALAMFNVSSSQIGILSTYAYGYKDGVTEQYDGT
jgi:hypothetical protein